MRRWTLGCLLSCAAQSACGYNPATLPHLDTRCTSSAITADPPAWTQSAQSTSENTVLTATLTTLEGSIPDDFLVPTSSIADISWEPLSGTLTIVPQTAELRMGLNELHFPLQRESTPEGCKDALKAHITRFPPEAALHVGPSPDACPHVLNTAVATNACDIVGDEFRSAIRIPDSTFIMYDASGSPAEYKGPFHLAANTVVQPAANVPTENIVLRCEGSEILKLVGNGTRVSNVSLFGKSGCHHAVLALNGAGETTSGHIIDGIIARNYDAEVYRANSVEEPLMLGPHSTVRNSLIIGYWEVEIPDTFDAGVTLLNNTFIAFQGMGRSGRASFAFKTPQGITVANNIFIHLGSGSRQFASFLPESDAVITGNIIEGAESYSGTSTPHASASEALNTLEAAQLLSPIEPHPLQNWQPSITMLEAEGFSIDGVYIDGSVPAFPGAYQRVSEQVAPRRQIIRFGQSSSTCGQSSCDVFAGSSPRALQQAAWRVWPAGTLEVHPSPNPYDGNLIVSWPTHIIGMGQSAAAVVLHDAVVSEVIRKDPVWRHEGMVNFLYSAMGSSLKHLKLTTDETLHTFMIKVEGRDSGAPVSLTQLWLHAGADATPADGIAAGSRTHIQDTLIQGRFSSCIHLGGHDSRMTSITSAWIANVTCRLTGLAADPRQAAILVGPSTGEIHLLNIAADAEQSVDAPLLAGYNSHRTDASLATTQRLYADALLYAGPRLADGIVFEVDPKPGLTSTPIFVSSSDSHLRSTSPARGVGVDPTEVEVASEYFTLGPNLDGTDRDPHNIDIGAY